MYANHIMQIDMAAIQQYQPGRVIPQITMDIIRRKVRKGHLMAKYVTVELRGVYEKISFSLMCTHLIATTG